MQGREELMRLGPLNAHHRSRTSASFFGKSEIDALGFDLCSVVTNELNLDRLVEEISLFAELVEHGIEELALKFGRHVGQQNDKPCMGLFLREEAQEILRVVGDERKRLADHDRHQVPVLCSRQPPPRHVRRFMPPRFGDADKRQVQALVD